ncbi:conserved exported protein of unknown function [Pseudorhizobium banfieldiae]|uniref:Uncharacterized protein n=1 Tax=Pseudorhizobium banfieldiae TaxID=1125847 RepID=L0NF46_9HYPH|nr:hypothetical protein [Pseudorhizobium banfieldiae]CAD6608141.1 hypothetical protein RNT25_02085 [arsenite-oxidising bacterium NT-25]CAD6615305.1 hypothetical protein RTCK_02816 [Rhizobium sp. TCK]CCF19441.1 conserved exported protein of unknown function [Pseudorhizobium banfieldiae]
MTLVVSVSANTAAYAADALKPARRLSAKDEAQDARVIADRGNLRAKTGDTTVDQLIPASTVDFDLLAPNYRMGQQATLAQVQAAYRSLED